MKFLVTAAADGERRLLQQLVASAMPHMPLGHRLKPKGWPLVARPGRSWLEERR
ncbi:MAG: hypothetical protein ABIR35_08700 [Polaromonas sp.]